jgi:hypothetical protein
LYSKDFIKRAAAGGKIGEVNFRDQKISVFFRNNVTGFESNAWFICLTSSQFQNGPVFLKLREYGKKMKDAIEKTGRQCVLKPSREVSPCQLKVLFNELKEHEKAADIYAKSNGIEVVDDLDNLDYSDL